MKDYGTVFDISRSLELACAVEENIAMDCRRVTFTRRSLLLMASLTVFILASWAIQQAHCNSSQTDGCVRSEADCTSLNLLNLRGFLSFHSTSAVSSDWGFIKHQPAAGVLYPESVDDIVAVVQAVARSKSVLTVAARGTGHSINGQAQALNGIVIEMSTLRGIKVMPHGDVDCQTPFVEATGGELWVDVLEATLKKGLAPRSWIDYLHLSVGGTLSNAGVSGQSFRHGPQISNVLQLEVVTGRGELLVCSPTKRSELFYAVLGGLGQFGIITKARIILEPAPQKVRWIRAMYTDFETFRRDQEMLISETDELHTFDYIEGFVVINNNNPGNGWKSVPFNPDHINASMIPQDAGSVMYYIELTKAYNLFDLPALAQRVEKMLAPLSFSRSLFFTTDVSYYTFLDRIHEVELTLRSQGLWEVPHPWVNLFVPGSSITKFDSLVFKRLITEEFSGPILVYPLNKSKWDRRCAVSVPEEEIFYIVAVLRNALPSSGPSLESILEDNAKILRVCESLSCKQYLPKYHAQGQWERHFGQQWESFMQRKLMFDPHAILTPGQNIFPRRHSLLAPA